MKPFQQLQTRFSIPKEHLCGFLQSHHFVKSKCLPSLDPDLCNDVERFLTDQKKISATLFSPSAHYYTLTALVTSPESHRNGRETLTQSILRMTGRKPLRYLGRPLHVRKAWSKHVIKRSNMNEPIFFNRIRLHFNTHFKLCLCY